MIGSLLTRGLVMVFGYAYPAYECFKMLEVNKPDIQQLSFWCQYWIIVATMTVCERIADSFISWVPMYSEAKLAFYIYLWFPKTKGTTYVYESFFKPLVQEHREEIDRNLEELKARAGDTIFSYWRKAAGYGKTRFLDILAYVAAQSTASPPSAPPRRQGSNKVTRPAAPPLKEKSKSAKETQTEEQPSSPPSSESSSEHEEAPPTTAQPAASSLNAQKTTPTKTITETSKASSSSSEAQVQIVTVHLSSSSSSDDKSTRPVSAEPAVVEEDVGRVTRARSRKKGPTAPEISQKNSK
ncbi:unnamed protein product [Cuscuta campestris]|uniref:HVA22-like protein n=2 Tax=Cuscuta sect. Cleistogrammica TaxID=1824901 RepID=A0A484K8Z5_9ASTE|nr:hypothetical protein DM860_006500 [Cuscuta australis]VFQ62451.1 unnamed protein product [Cuscuta campestris]